MGKKHAITPVPNTVNRNDTFATIRANPRDFDIPPPIPSPAEAKLEEESKTDHKYIDYNIKLMSVDGGKNWIECNRITIEIRQVECAGTVWHQPIVHYSDMRGITFGKLSKTLEQAAKTIIFKRMVASEQVVAEAQTTGAGTDAGAGAG